MTVGLKLKAESADDLAVLSAMLQDAVCKTSDLSFLPKSRRFAAVLNRFVWEKGARDKRGQRTRSGLRFEGVLAARRKDVPQTDPDHVLALLSVTVNTDEKGAFFTLNFSGGAEIELKAEYIEVYLEDISGPWKALQRPHHNLDEG